MKKVLTLGLLLGSAMFAVTGFAKANEESLDQIVAVVNDDVVTKSELTHALSNIKVQIAQEHAPVPAEPVLQKQVLDQLINKKLQMQIAKQASVNVNDAELNQAIEHVASQNNMSVSALYQRLNQEGMSTPDYRSEMHDQLVLQKLQQQEVVSHITITPQEIDNFMHSNAWRKNDSKEYRLDDILIPMSEAPSPEEITAAQKRAGAVIAKLNQGQNFKSLAQAESGDKNALQGGDLGWRKLPEIPSAFAEQVTNMNPNEVAGPIQTPNGFHIIQLAGVRAADGGASAAPNRKEIEELLMRRKFEEAVQNWVSKLRGQAFIALNTDKQTTVA